VTMRALSAGASFCFLWLLGAQICACSKGASAPDGGQVGTDPSQPATLEVRLKTDKESYRQGEEIHWLVEYVNKSDASFRVLVDETFAGTGLVCSTEAGEPVEAEGGYKSWSPKAGVFTGRTRLIDPGETLTLRLDSLADFQRDLVFRYPGPTEANAGDSEFKKRLGLPDDYPAAYLSAGRRLPVGKPGVFVFRWVYEAGENDKRWTFAAAQTPEEASVDRLWLGKAESNNLRLEIR
jgi:hypothetical protein